MDEELETAKEELQSINEALTTLNEELQVRNQEVGQINIDLLNFAAAVDIAILTLDDSGCIRRLTPKACSVLNVLPTDIGKPIDALNLNITVPNLRAQIETVSRTRVVIEREVQDYAGRWYRLQIHPRIGAEEVVDGVLLSFVDIDALKQLIAEAQQARAEAERANLAKDDFLATLSHELRTPLSSMLLNAQLLRDGHLRHRAELERVGESLERATRTQVKLVDDLLDVSRIVTGKLTLECHEVDLSRVVQESIESVSSLIGAKELVLEVSIDPELDLVWADRVRVQQVISNLLTNAVKFSERGGLISVAVDSSEGAARLRVMDAGIGIAAEFVPHVFERFTQGDTKITRNYGGLGLGLALVRHLVELHGGTVRAQSDGEGRGSAFTVTFPFSMVPDERPSRLVHVLDRPGRTQAHEGLAGLRILVIDDDLRTREALLEVMQLAGARVELAANAAQGMIRVDTFKPQVILCDIAMPGEDGYSFIRKLRAREAGHAPIPALALTALATQEDRRRALLAGFQLHLAKPIDIDRLREAVVTLGTMQSPSS